MTIAPGLLHEPAAQPELIIRCRFEARTGWTVRSVQVAQGDRAAIVDFRAARANDRLKWLARALAALKRRHIEDAGAQLIVVQTDDWTDHAWRSVQSLVDDVRRKRIKWAKKLADVLGSGSLTHFVAAHGRKAGTSRSLAFGTVPPSQVCISCRDVDGRASPMEPTELYALEHDRHPERPRATDEPVVFLDHYEDRIAFEQAIVDLMRACQNERVSLDTWSSLPPFVTRPWNMQERRQRAVFTGDQKVCDQVIAALRTRYSLWEDLVRSHGVRLILDFAETRRYFTNGLDIRPANFPFTRTEILAQISQWTRLLECHDRFEVALLEAGASGNFICGPSTLVVQYNNRQPDDSPRFIGVRGHALRDRQSIDKHKRAFANVWNSRRPDAKPKLVVWLKELLGGASSASSSFS